MLHQGCPLPASLPALATACTGGCSKLKSPFEIFAPLWGRLGRAGLGGRSSPGAGDAAPVGPPRSQEIPASHGLCQEEPVWLHPTPHHLPWFSRLAQLPFRTHQALGRKTKINPTQKNKVQGYSPKSQQAVRVAQTWAARKVGQQRSPLTSVPLSPVAPASPGGPRGP